MVKQFYELAKIVGINKNTAEGIINRFNKNGGIFVERSRSERRTVKLAAEILAEIGKIVEQSLAATNC